jgi:hypothetical protein
MRTIAHIIRGTVGIATTWALSWAAVAFTLASLTWIVNPWAGGFLAVAGPVTLAAVFCGAVAGKVFALALGTLFRNRTLAELRPGRMALIGAVGGIVLPLAGAAVLALLGTSFAPVLVGASLLASGGLGAVMAGGTTRIAQRTIGALGSGDPPQR